MKTRANLQTISSNLSRSVVIMGVARAFDPIEPIFGMIDLIAGDMGRGG